MNLYPPRAYLAEALPRHERALVRYEEHLRQERFASCEQRLSQLLSQLYGEAERLYSMARAWPDESRVRHLALRAALLSKGLSVPAHTQLVRTLSRHLKPEDREAFEHLRAVRTALSELRLVGSSKRSGREHRKCIESLATQAEALEEELAQSWAPLKSLREQPRCAELVPRVAAALPREGVLVEFVAFRERPLNLQAEPSRADREAPARYLALLLFPDGRTGAVDLGEAEPLEAAAHLLHRSLASHSAAWHRAAQELHALTIRPLLSRLGAARRLFIAPDGWLTLVPFGELHDGKRFLAEVFEVTPLASGRDLLPRHEALPRGRGILYLSSPEAGL